MDGNTHTLTLAEVSELFRLSTATYRRHIKSGTAPIAPLPGSRRYRFSRHEVEVLLGPLTDWSVR